MVNVEQTCATIQAARTPVQVFSAVNGYLEHLPGDSMSLMKPALVAGGIEHARQLATTATELVRLEANAASSEVELAVLREAGMVFSTAAMRLAVLAIGEDG